jgi:hypothetical protein
MYILKHQPLASGEWQLSGGEATPGGLWPMLVKAQMYNQRFKRFSPKTPVKLKQTRPEAARRISSSDSCHSPEASG